MELSSNKQISNIKEHPTITYYLKIEFPVLLESEVEKPNFVYNKDTGEVVGTWDPKYTEDKKKEETWVPVNKGGRARPNPDRFTRDCDECGGKIILPNTQYCCTVCGSFDLCSECYKNGKLRDLHDTDHRFMHIEKPTNIHNINCVICGDWYTGFYKNWVLEDLSGEFVMCTKCYKQQLKKQNSQINQNT